MRTAAAKRYQRRFTIASVLYGVMIAANVVISRALSPSQLVLGLMALITALPIVAMLAVMGLYLREETDEFIRHRLVTSMLAAIGILLSATSILGFLQFEKIVGEVPVFLAFPIWCLLFGAVQGVLCARDRNSGEEA